MGRKKNGADHEQYRTSIVDQADPTGTLQAKTLRGDIRDRILAEFKGMHKPWQQMNEAEQERIIHLAADIAGLVVNRAVEIAAHEGAPHLVVEIGQWGVKEGLKIQLGAAATLENGTQLLAHHGPAVLVLIDPLKFKGQRAPAKTDVVGSLAIPREPGVHGDELPDDPTDPGPIPPSLDRRTNGAGPSMADPPFAAPPEDGVRHV
jgi:hypothetical protein